MAKRPVKMEMMPRNSARELHGPGMGDLTLRWLASQLGPDWEKVASFLGFTASEIRTFKTDNPLQTEEQAFQAFVKWRQRQPLGEDQTTAVCSALREARRVDLAEQLRERTRQQDLCCRDPSEAEGPRCETHPREVIRFFCETCTVSICHLCTVIDHCKSKHDIAHIGEAARMYRHVLKEIMLPGLGMEIEELERSLKEISRAKRIFIKHFVQTKTELMERFQEAEAEGTLEGKHMVDAMRDLRRQRDWEFGQLEARVSNLLRRKQESRATAWEISKNDQEDRDFLAVYHWIRQRIEHQSSQRPPEVDPGLSCLERFRTSSPDSRYPRPGELDLGGSLELHGDSGRQGVRNRGEETLVMNGARGVAILACREIAVADHFNRRVVICNTEGQPQRVIPVPGNPYDVAASPTSNRIVVVDSTSYVRVFSKDDKLLAEFPTVPRAEVDDTEVDLRSVAVWPDGTILVGDIKRKVWTEHCPTEGVLLRTVPVKTKPYYMSVNNDRVVVSGLKQRARVLDTNGDKVFTIKPTVDGEAVEQLTGVCYASSGIFTTMNNRVKDTGHIHHYDERGAFLGCLDQGLRLPLGIACTAHGRELAVADWDGSVRMYNFNAYA
ncbi:uncharacterized protein LOC119736029 [Patiria miniata]|uniref:B box-type domain-containing protein n=1 Tax=Patiria miniata TaxID=46514 RepID=A0A914AR77_PATMI|nr:uncharacterized protein LOC119736029 [Patiria miniata]